MVLPVGGAGELTYSGSFLAFLRVGVVADPNEDLREEKPAFQGSVDSNDGTMPGFIISGRMN